MIKNIDDKHYTAYLVANRSGRTFLNRPVYTGRKNGVWSPLQDSFVFRSKTAAAKCAYDVNRRSDSDEPFAFVVPVQLER